LKVEQTTQNSVGEVNPRVIGDKYNTNTRGYKAISKIASSRETGFLLSMEKFAVTVLRLDLSLCGSPNGLKTYAIKESATLTGVPGHDELGQGDEEEDAAIPLLPVE